jgi:hypothetical protein
MRQEQNKSENLKSTVNAIVEGNAYICVTLDEESNPNVFCYSSTQEAALMIAILQNYLNQRITESRDEN